MTLAGGAVAISFLGAVFVSNLPEAIAATGTLRVAGQERRRILRLWFWAVASAAVVAAVGFLLVTNISGVDGAFAQAFGAGAVLTMLADPMMPEAFEHGGKAVGLLTVLGYAVATALAQL